MGSIPAYDLTYSYSIGGEHATTVNGNGRDPGLKEILEVAKKVNLDMNYAKKTALAIEKIVYEDLKEYLIGDKSKIRLRTRYKQIER